MNTRSPYHKLTMIIACFTFFISNAFGQNIQPIPKSAFDTLTRQSFSRMVSGSTAAPNFQNYISFNPTDGKFTANGFFSIKNKNAISVTASGGLIKDNVAVLFDGGNINTATDLSAKIHLRLDKKTVQLDMKDLIPINDQRINIETEKDQKKNQLIRDLNGLQFAINDLKYQRNVLFQTHIKLRSDSIIEKGKWDVCFRINDTTCLQNSAKVLAKISGDLKKWVTDTTRIRKKIDSLTLISVLDGLAFKPLASLTNDERALFVVYGLGKKSFRERRLDEIDKEYNKKIESLYINQIPNKEISISYLTIAGTIARLGYRTYDPSFPFDSQIQKKDFTGYSYGLEFNRLQSSDLFKRYFFFNAGLLYKRTNNLADLSTTKITNDTNTSSGSVTRKVTNEYNVYTDPIVEFSLWNFYANYYRLATDGFGSGVHFFIDFQFRDSGKSIYNLGGGYIFGITNAKDKRLINIEPFLRFNDVSGSLDEKPTSLIKKSQIGISFGLPIYFPTATQKTK
ncbi:MAG: hypothetical protein ACK5RG_14410 [Cyclobacteriaceae bacterium]|jgi:hypothetical protein|nr:hypothetical protein [Flammeovirgaceae bacterium]